MYFLTVFLVFTFSLVAADTLLIKSVDAGKTWIDINPSSTDQYFESLQIDSHGSTLYALTQSSLGEEWHLSVSLDRGETWQIRQSFPREISKIAASSSPTEPDTLYIAYELHGYPMLKVMMAKVTNRGGTMEQYSADGLALVNGGGFTYDVLAALKADSRTPEKLYAFVTRDPGNDEIFALFQGVWTSLDSGRNWRRLEPPVADGCLYPEMQLDGDSSIYVACGNQLFKSTDEGASWSLKPFPDGQRLWNLQIGPGGTLYSNRRGDIWKSIDGAETWQRRGTFPTSTVTGYLIAHPIDPAVIFVNTRDGIAKSEDGGETWIAVTEYSLQPQFLLQLVIDPQMPGTFFLRSWRRQQLRLPSDL